MLCFDQSVNNHITPRNDGEIAISKAIVLKMKSGSCDEDDDSTFKILPNQGGDAAFGPAVSDDILNADWGGIKRRGASILLQLRMIFLIVTVCTIRKNSK